MANPDDLNDEAVIEHLVDDPVVTNANPKGAGFAGHRHATRRARVVGQQIDSGANPLLFSPGQGGQCLHGSPGELDPVRHLPQAQVRLDLVPGHVVVVVTRSLEFPAISCILGSRDDLFVGVGVNDHGNATTASRHVDRLARASGLLDDL